MRLIIIPLAGALIILASASTQAQTVVINGSVKDAAGRPIEKASVSLLNAKDSSQVKGVYTSSAGQYAFRNIHAGNYLVLVSTVGMLKQYSQPFTAGNDPVAVSEIRLVPESKRLQELNIVGKKQLVEQKIDRMLINVDASPTNTGLTVMDVLQKSPGISVDKDGNISLKGKSGVLVMLDGKPTYLSSQDLANLLKNMPASQLDQIELMTNPPAKYDAAGNAGIINLRTKKIKTRGLNGNVNLGIGQGWGFKSNNSINLNYRTANVNVFANYSVSTRRNRNTLDLTRKFRDSASQQLTSEFQQSNTNVHDYTSHNFKAGLDYSVNKRTTLGVVFTGQLNPGYDDASNISHMVDGGGKLDSINITNSHIKQHWQNWGANINFAHSFDTAGHEISADLDYLTYDTKQYQDYENNFYQADGITPSRPTELLRGLLPSTIHIYTGKVDYVHLLKHNWKLEAGAKSSFVKTDNDAQYADYINEKWVTDSRSNHFVYRENINAAYANVSKEFSKKWKAQLGLRLENTIAKGDQKTTDQHFDRNYTQLFPTTYVQYGLNDNNQFVLSFGRRIQRPSYQDMNPFYEFIDPYTYEVGNPYLKPQFSNNVELSHTFKGMLTTTINYTQTNDVIQQIILQDDETHTVYVQRGNVAKQKNYGIAVNLGLPVTKWWRTNIYVNGFHNMQEGPINNTIVRAAAFGVEANMNNTFTFSHGWSAEVSGWFQGKDVGATATGDPMGAINMGVSKQVLKSKGTVKINVNDPFNLAHFKGYSRYSNVDLTILNHWDNRVAYLNFTYRFGKVLQNAPKHRGSNSANEEQNRVKGNN